MPTEASPPPRFLADVMLGRLARWLRALGFDTRYESTLDDAALAALAQREGRVLLTRDVELTRRRNVRAFLIQDDKLVLQLRQIVAAFALRDTAAFSRCLECNVELVQVSRETIVARVPRYVWQTQERFFQCPHCSKVYWRGTHWARMQQLLRKVEMNADG